MRVDIKNAADRASIMPLIRDVSASGFSFVSEKEFEIGQRVSLFYESDGGKVVEFTGKIVRSLFNDSRKNFVYGCLLSGM